MEWVRFWITAALLAAALIAFASAVVGVWKFRFVMNRIHAAGIGDSIGLFCVTAAAMIGSGELMDMLKLALIVVFMWFTSPASTHFLSRIEYRTDPDVLHYAEMGDEEPPGGEETE